MNDKVQAFWDAQAVEHGASDLATAPDHYYRELEIAKIIEHLRPDENVLDVGCGNGYSTEIFHKHVASVFTGIDYSVEMIEAALKTTPESSYFIGDVRDIPFGSRRFHTIISERCLINLASWDEQQQALLEMKRCLRPGGRIILVENFTDGLKKLNGLRAQFDLHEIEVRWHNRYLSFIEFDPFINRHFNVTHCENIGNLYYIISRVVYAALAKADDREPEYGHLINKIASQLPTLGQNIPYFSPNFLLVLEAR